MQLGFFFQKVIWGVIKNQLRKWARVRREFQNGGRRR